MIKSVSLINFRNHKQLNLKFNNSFVYINGSNGSGKTSVLEAINYIATTKSHRTNNDIDVIRRGEVFSKIVLETTSNRYELVISEQGKIASLNNKEIRKLSDFISKLKVVLFAPEDLNLIKGSPSIRRSFIDLELTKIKRSYLRNLTDYRNILKQRNALLKNISLDDDLTFLNILGNQLYEVGIKVIEQRSEFIKLLNEQTKLVYKDLSSNEINVLYQPSVDKEAFMKHITKNQKQDILYQTTNVGPHRDDFIVKYNENNAANSSQGEIRLMVIAIKLGLLKVFKNAVNENVVLLLDDVLSELDQTRQKVILDKLPKDIQIIMNSAIKIKSDKIDIITLKGDKENNE